MSEWRFFYSSGMEKNWKVRLSGFLAAHNRRYYVMSYAIATKLLSPTELQYLELKKEHAAEKANSQTAHSSRKQRDTGIVDQVMLSSNIDPDEASKRKPSQPVTADESRALREQLSIYV